MKTFLQAALSILWRDLRLNYQQKMDWMQPLFFLMLFIIIIPLSLDPNPQKLAEIASGMIWMAAVLASLLSVENLFKSDFQDGTLEQLFVLPYPSSLLIFMKIFAHWLSAGLPITVLSIPLALMLYLPPVGIITLFMTLLLGTPILTFLGAIGSALALHLHRGGLLLALLLLPLYIPILILGAGSVYASIHGFPVAGQLAILGAMLIGSFLITPLITTSALRLSLTG